MIQGGNKMNYFTKKNEKTVLGEIREEMRKSIRVKRFFTTSGRADSMWAPGAFDGVMSTHVKGGETSVSCSGLAAASGEKTGAGMSEEDVLACIISRDFTKAREGMLGLMPVKGPGALEKVLVKQAEDHPDTPENEAIRLFAKQCLIKGSDEDEVKTGLVLIRMFPGPDMETKEAVMDLALYDEMTKLAIQAIILAWKKDEINEALFEVARHTYGWGRIETVGYIKPETEEIRDWFLFEGYKNDIMDDYTIIDAAEKSGLAERLEGKITEKEYCAAGEIISRLLTADGPIMDPIGWVSDRDGHSCGRKLLLNFLRKSEEAIASDDFHVSEMDIRRYVITIFCSGGRWEDIKQAASHLVTTEDGIRYVLRNPDDLWCREVIDEFGLPLPEEKTAEDEDGDDDFELLGLEDGTDEEEVEAILEKIRAANKTEDEEVGEK